MFQTFCFMLVFLPVLVYSFTNTRIEFNYEERQVDVVRFVGYYTLAQISIFFISLTLALFSTLSWTVALIGTFKFVEFMLS